MEHEVQFKIYKDKNLAKYLKENSYWYRDLNRSPENLKNFLSEYKKNKRNENITKVNGAIDTLETVNSIFSIFN